VAQSLFRFEAISLFPLLFLHTPSLRNCRLRPHIVLAPAQKPPRQWRDEHTAQASLLSHSLDERLHVLTTHWQSHGKVLVRVAHMYETGEDSILSQPLTVDLASLFSNFRIVSATGKCTFVCVVFVAYFRLRCAASTPMFVCG